MKVATRYRSGKSDGELLIAAGAGDRRALEELYLGYQRRLARFLSRFTRRGVIVEEIINDTFVVVWRHANEFRFASQVSSWIFGIACRLLSNLAQPCEDRGHDILRQPRHATLSRYGAMTRSCRSSRAK